MPTGGNVPTGGGVTDGGGGSSGCTTPADCPGRDTTCSTRTCDAGVCGTDDAPAGTSCNEDGGEACDGMGNCIAGNCTDGVMNGVETDVDCGGGVCEPCPNDDGCEQASDCVSLFCDNLTCAACSDNGQCGGECNTCDVGAGGICGPAAAGSSCGDQGVDCLVDDTCDGSGACVDNGFATMGATCGDLSTSDCSQPDSCNATGTCLDNHASNGASCSDCPAGAGSCLECQSGVCTNQPCGSSSCLLDSDCTSAATNGICDDDCNVATCVGATPSNPIEAGIATAEDLGDWDSDDAETVGPVWYCNAALPVSAAGLLTVWQIWVDNDGDPGDRAQLMVIRCSAGGGGGGPVLSGCTRVGLGPPQQVNNDGLWQLTLAGSTQLDGATANANGIVVQAGDWICADALDYSIGVDCNGSIAGGGCPGPDFNTQFGGGIDSAGQPFALQNSNSNGTLMIRAFGNDQSATMGSCDDAVQEADGTSCSSNGGDTCCNATCIVGPSGPGTCM